MALKEGVSEPLIAAIQATPGARRAKPGFPQPPGLRAGAGLPGLRLGVALPALRRQPGAAPGRPPPALPPLRLRKPHSESLPHLRQPGHPPLRAWHPAPGKLAAGTVPRSPHPARRPRLGEEPQAVGSGARTHPRRRGRYPGRHADAGQGPRLPQARPWSASWVPIRPCSPPTAGRRSACSPS